LKTYFCKYVIIIANIVKFLLGQDEAGRKATEEILPRLSKKVFVREIELPDEGDQPDKLREEYIDNFLSVIKK